MENLIQLILQIAMSLSFLTAITLLLISQINQAKNGRNKTINGTAIDIKHK